MSSTGYANLFDLSNRTAVVLGATGALGGAIAQALGECGATVYVGGRSRERGLERVEKIAMAGGVAHFAACDATNADDLARVRDQVLAASPTLDILVNAAGGNRPDATLPPGADFCALPLEAWRGVFDLNLIGGVLLPCQVFGAAMVQAQGGSIINIASLSGMTPLSRVVAYSAAKAAVLNLTQFLAREWAPRNVRVNALSPGFFPAEQNRALLFREDGSYTERGQQIIGHTPMARFGSAPELAGAAVWLASERASSFVTGQNIVVDGGFSSTTI
jgi:NAD(P)-dependent dehydrogenase (short-subunit alcohol dehydrogenase family)